MLLDLRHSIRTTKAEPSLCLRGVVGTEGGPGDSEWGEGQVGGSWSGKLTPCGQKHESKQDAGDVGHGKCYMTYIEQVQLLRKLRFFCVFKDVCI